MSAFIVSRPHIDRLVSTATAWRYCMPRDKTPDELGRVLWSENVTSVAFRYEGSSMDDLPGPCDFTPDEAEAYTWHICRPLTPVQALKAIACYEYQSCEHPTWEQSPAYEFVQAFRAEAISRLDGYDAAPWEWDE